MPTDFLELCRFNDVLSQAELKEGGRANEYAELFKEVLEGLGANLDAPLQTEILVARTKAQLIWRWGRSGGNAKWHRELVESRRDLVNAEQKRLAGIEMDFRGAKLLLDAVLQADDLLHALRECVGTPKQTAKPRLKVVK